MYAVLSDIHGNLYALEKVIQDMNLFDIDGIIILGDLIDYGMQSNEVIEYVESNLKEKIICNIWGNHENAILRNDYSFFSSQRGVDSAKRTACNLTSCSKAYLRAKMNSTGRQELEIESKRVLAVHGSLDNVFWKSIEPDNVRGDYTFYDIVLSGHSHYSHSFTKFYDVDDIERRNKHAVVFVNPGSVGQPRNHNSNAQYAIIDFKTGSIMLRAVEYDIEAAMNLFDESVDEFYRERLIRGV